MITSAIYEPAGKVIMAFLDNGNRVPVCAGDVKLQGFTSNTVTYINNTDHSIRVWYEEGREETIGFDL